jgi:hypothetical protein
VVEAGTERDAALVLARDLVEHPPAGVMEIRHLLRRTWLLEREAAFAEEVDIMTRLAASTETRDRLEAFRRRARRTA